MQLSDTLVALAVKVTPGDDVSISSSFWDEAVPSVMVKLLIYGPFSPALRGSCPRLRSRVGVPGSGAGQPVVSGSHGR